jgi:1,4-alpha-glucan branching enzyme
MGGEFGQWREWDHNQSLDWHLLEYFPHRGVQRLVKDLNELYRKEKALHELDCDPAGFEWVDFSDYEQSVISFLRKSRSGEMVLVVLNFTPVPRYNYRVGVPKGGLWLEIFNSDSELYGGANIGNMGRVMAEDVPFHGRPYSLSLTLPPLGAVFLKPAYGIS